MTPQPNPPACIAEALFYSASESIEQVEQEWVDYMAQAVWDALLAEGRIETKWHRKRGHPMFPQTDEETEYRVFVLGLPLAGAAS